VVVISTANGLKFVDFKVRYHESSAPGANRALEVGAGYDEVRKTVDRVLV
jgi:hypothetical protein